MAKNGKKGTKLAKAALARISNITSGATSITDARVSPMAQSLGITFDGNNNVLDNEINDNIALINAKIDSLATLLGVTFDGLGGIVTETYTQHSHDYEDDDGVTLTTKATGGVN